MNYKLTLHYAGTKGIVEKTFDNKRDPWRIYSDIEDQKLLTKKIEEFTDEGEIVRVCVLWSMCELSKKNEEKERMAVGKSVRARKDADNILVICNPVRRPYI